MSETIILKLSGEHVKVDPRLGLVLTGLEPVLAGIAELRRAGFPVGIVTGGGNISRGRFADDRALPEAVADKIGIMGTIINAVLVATAVEQQGMPAAVYTAVDFPMAGRLYNRAEVMADLAAGKVVLFGGGIACRPYSTDVAAALYASELDGRFVFKGTNVAGIFERDPRADPAAPHVPSITHADYLSRGYTVIDPSAVALCLQRNIELVVYDTRAYPSIMPLLERVKHRRFDGFSLISSAGDQ